MSIERINLDDKYFESKYYYLEPLLKTSESKQEVITLLKRVSQDTVIAAAQNIAKSLNEETKKTNKRIIEQNQDVFIPL